MVNAAVRFFAIPRFLGLLRNFTTFRQAGADRLVREAQLYDISRSSVADGLSPFALKHGALLAVVKIGWILSAFTILSSLFL